MMNFIMNRIEVSTTLFTASDVIFNAGQDRSSCIESPHQQTHTATSGIQPGQPSVSSSPSTCDIVCIPLVLGIFIGGAIACTVTAIALHSHSWMILAAATGGGAVAAALFAAIIHAWYYRASNQKEQPALSTSIPPIPSIPSRASIGNRRKKPTPNKFPLKKPAAPLSNSASTSQQATTIDTSAPDAENQAKSLSASAGGGAVNGRESAVTVTSAPVNPRSTPPAVASTVARASSNSSAPSQAASSAARTTESSGAVTSAAASTATAATATATTTPSTSSTPANAGGANPPQH